MNILAVDTSCDETAVAVTDGTKVITNVVWSQASLHAKWGGVVPSLAQRQHEERIDWVIKRAIGENKIDAVAVTEGPGLAIALGVGIGKAKELARKWGVPIVGVNHIEGHILSALANNEKVPNFPAVAMAISGKHTELIYVERIGRYKILARTTDDALGEALDKAARMLGLGYPGGAVLEKMAKLGNPKAYPLPLPMAGREDRGEFSYSGLKTAFWRLTNNKDLSRQDVYDLAASFQDMAFKHLIRISKNVLSDYQVKDILVGGGVAANVELRKRIRKMAKELGIKTWFPYSKKLYGDNAAMIGVVAGFKAKEGRFDEPENIDRKPRWTVNDV